MGRGTTGRSFAGASGVGRYWQTRCRGFEVRSTGGRRLGRVEGIELTRGKEVAALVVSRRYRRSIRVRPDRVGSIDPWERTLTVASEPRERKVLRSTAATARLTAGAARSGGRLALETRRLGPPARRAALAAATRTWELRRVGRPAGRVL